MTPDSTDSPQVQTLIIEDELAGQRLDNYLLKILKGVPKSVIYRIIRSGEVRVNGKRADPMQRLAADDKLRIPPIRVAAPTAARDDTRTAPPRVFDILYEDDAMLAINKPAGIAVHGGSGISFGVIETLRRQRPTAKLLELVHRLDRETSGVLLIAKKRSALVKMHDMMREGTSDKRYLALVLGDWKKAKLTVQAPLLKFLLPDGERRVKVDSSGQSAHTIFRLQERLPGSALLEAELKTGRTHQIRVHLLSQGFPIAGDDKYGDFTVNKQLAKAGLKRMFLHAFCLRMHHPLTGEPLTLNAPLPADLADYLNKLRTTAHQ